MTGRTRRGFTLVELLVVIAIISLLIAMLLPAIQAARESGRRAVCQSNLAQFGKAVHIFHERNNSMPTYFGWFPESGTAYVQRMHGTWYMHLMPVMDQEPAHRMTWDTEIQASAVSERHAVAVTPGGPGPCYKTSTSTEHTCETGSYGSVVTPGGNSSNHNGHTHTSDSREYGCVSGGVIVGQPTGSTTTSTTVEISCDTPVLQGVGRDAEAARGDSGVLHCASDPSETSPVIKWRFSYNYALTNYQANFNVFARARQYSGNKPQTFGAISDGLANTALFAEGHRVCDPYSDKWGVRVTTFADPKRHNFGIDWSETANTYMFQDAPTPAQCNNWRMQANHGGALLVALGDGSARGISKNISRKEVSDPDSVALGGNPDMGSGPLGSWDSLLLGDDGQPVSIE